MIFHISSYLLLDSSNRPSTTGAVHRPGSSLQALRSPEAGKKTYFRDL